MGKRTIFKTCLNCNKFVQRNHYNFCSHECKKVYNNIYISCTNCGTNFCRTKSGIKKNNFCSQKCSTTFNNRIIIRRKKVKTCKSCFKDISHFSKRTKCDECLPSVPEHLTLLELRSRNKYQIHSGIRGFSRKKYLASNKPKFCVICKYDLHFDVCHIKPINSFSDNNTLSDVNHIDNLIALCKNHHWELDNKFLSESIVKEAERKYI